LRKETDKHKKNHKSDSSLKVIFYQCFMLCLAIDFTFLNATLVCLINVGKSRNSTTMNKTPISTIPTPPIVRVLGLMSVMGSMMTSIGSLTERMSS